MTVLLVVAGLVALAAAAPAVARRTGRDTGWLLGAGFAMAAGAVAALGGPVVRGTPVRATVSWVPQAGLEASVLLDGLALLFALLMLVVGALVMCYAARYLPLATTHGRLFGWLTLFAAAMLGLVVADDLIMLVICWELTSISSFMLIAGRGEHRAPATRAFVTTTAGGLALLAAAALIAGGTGMTRLSQVLAAPELVRDSAVGPAVAVLLIVAAATKSAQVPFHFWLPGAMVAPTPISTYLHAATMVKAGVYLLLRFTPVFSVLPMWRATLLILGLSTALWGALLALKRHDLKAILAYSTISQLGLLVALTGIATPTALTAAALLLLAHAGYKATLFMVAGVVDHAAHTRDIRELTGLRHDMPLTAAVAGVAALSMAGVPPLLGFVGKEWALGAVLGLTGATWVLAAALSAVAALSVLTVAYSGRLFAGAFAGAPGAGATAPARALVVPAAVTALASVALGTAVPALQPLIDGFLRATHGAVGDGHLTLWHGVTPEVALSLAILCAGAGLLAARHPIERRLSAIALPARAHGVATYDRLYAAVLQIGAVAARTAAARAPTVYVAAVVATVLAVGASFAVLTRPPLAPPTAATQALDWVVITLIAGALLLLTVTRDRLTTAMLLGIVGYLVALWFAMLGAADLALTLLLVETLFVAAIVLSLRSLRGPLIRQRPRGSLPAVCLSAVAGVLAGAAAWSLTGRRPLSEPGTYFLERAEEVAGGRNVVNTILVDFRALDTLGEIVVVVVAIMGLSVVAGWARRRRSP